MRYRRSIRCGSGLVLQDSDDKAARKTNEYGKERDETLVDK